MSKRSLTIISLLLPLLAGWSNPHFYISEVALETLPQWQIDIVKSETENFINTYCKIPDLAREPEYKEKWTPYLLQGYYIHFAWETEKNYPVYEYYTNTVYKKLKAGDIEDAMKFLGAFSHFLQDSTCPAHFRYSAQTKFTPESPKFISLEFLKKLMLVPEKYRDTNLHKVVDLGGFDLDQLRETVGKYKPRLLGATLDEAIFNLATRHEQLMDESKQCLIPMVSGYLEDNQEKYKRYGLMAAACSTKLNSDFLYTIFCIAADKFDANELSQLKNEAYLTDIPVNSGIIYYSERPNYYGVPAEGAKSQSPIKLKMKDGSVKDFGKGFLVIPNAEYTFIVPGGLFKTFSTYVGQDTEKGQKGSCAFEILLDDKSAKRTGIIKGDQSAKLLSVKLKNAHKITIRTIGDKKEKTAQAVWAEPVLKK